MFVCLETGLFDGISIGFVGNTALPEELNVLTKIASLLKPDGRILLRKGERDLCRMERILRSLKFAGFVSIEEQGELVSASTPNYAAGTRFDINTKALLAPKSEASSQSLWSKLAEDNQDDLIDTDQLLTEDDLKQPDPESLRVCGTTGVRKACANCVCGLAQELDAEASEQNRQVNKAMPSSSCGSVSVFIFFNFNLLIWLFLIIIFLLTNVHFLFNLQFDHTVLFRRRFPLCQLSVHRTSGLQTG